MNDVSLFLQDEEVMKKIQSTLTELLQKTFSLAVVPKPPKVVTFDNPMPLDSLGHLRVNGEGKTGVIPLGFSDEATERALEGVFKADTSGSNAGSLETYTLKALSSALSPLLLKYGLAKDSQSLITITDGNLMGWKSFSFTKAIQIPYTFNGKELALYVPILDADRRAELSQSIFGFSETATLLVADDSPIIMKLSRQILQAYGYLNLVECTDGEQAANYLSNPGAKIDVVLSDWRMPKFTGIQLLKLVRSKIEFKQLPVVMITGERNKPEVLQAIQEGVSGYIVKPYDARTLMETLKKASNHGKSAPRGAKAA